MSRDKPRLAGVVSVVVIVVLVAVWLFVAAPWYSGGPMLPR
jgi:hypothetical protein